MPISEDELEHKGPPQHHQSYHCQPHVQIQQVSAMSKAEQRRSNKPIMEKRRRARINHCLNELKTLILDAMKKDPARHSKLEKADILEMTVKHLQNVQRQQLAVAVATDPTVLHKFRTGFNECAGEVSRYIGRIEGVDPAIRSRLLAHLASCVSGLHQLTPFSFGAMAAASTPPPPQIPFATNIPSSAMPTAPDDGSGVLSAPPPTSDLATGAYPIGDVNNNQSQRQSVVPMGGGLGPLSCRHPSADMTPLLLPGRIPTEIPFPPSSARGGPSPSSSGSSPGQALHHSAFTAVARVSPPPAPPSPASSPTSSCASTSCDSSSFPTSSPASHEVPKFSFGFPAPASMASTSLPSGPRSCSIDAFRPRPLEECREDPIDATSTPQVPPRPSLIFCPPAPLLPPPPPIFLPRRDVLDFSLKKENRDCPIEVAVIDSTTHQGTKRSTSPVEGEEASGPAAKMAKLEVKVEQTSTNDASEEDKGRNLSTESIAVGCSSAMASPSEESSTMDMWRPW